MLLFGTRAGFEDEPVRTRFVFGVSTSPITKLIAPLELSSLITWSGIEEMLGGSFTGLTVSMNESVALDAPSLTVRVTRAVPVWFANGVTATVRFGPDPPKTIFPFGTSAGFEELPVRTRLAGDVSTSPMTNPIGAC